MYLMYLDESGHSNLKNPRIREQSDFFVLGGLIIKEEDYFEYDTKFKELKSSLFPKELVKTPVHAVELNHIERNRNNKYKKYINQERANEILKVVYEFISSMPIEAIVIVIDNHNLKLKYLDPENPYLLAYRFILERFQKIISGRDEKCNSLGIVNISKSSTKLNTNLKKAHSIIRKKGTNYVKDFKNIFKELNIENVNNSSYYEIADLICYAFQRSYYAWLCHHLGRACDNEGYLETLKPICKLDIGKVILNKSIRVKVFPEPRFIKKTKPK